jgi:hypothetical protein
MSGGITIRFIDFAVFLFAFDRVCFVSFWLFLVRNWCGLCLVKGYNASGASWGNFRKMVSPARSASPEQQHNTCSQCGRIPNPLAVLNGRNSEPRLQQFA